MLSHAGAARFAFNAGLAHVKAGIEAGEKLDWSYYALVRWWNANKDARGEDTSRADTTSGNADPNETRTKQPPTSGMRLGAGLGNETMRF